MFDQSMDGSLSEGGQQCVFTCLVWLVWPSRLAQFGLSFCYTRVCWKHFGHTCRTYATHPSWTRSPKTLTQIDDLDTNSAPTHRPGP